MTGDGKYSLRILREHPTAMFVMTWMWVVVDGNLEVLRRLAEKLGIDLDRLPPSPLVLREMLQAEPRNHDPGDEDRSK